MNKTIDDCCVIIKVLKFANIIILDVISKNETNRFQLITPRYIDWDFDFNSYNFFGTVTISDSISDISHCKGCGSPLEFIWFVNGKKLYICFSVLIPID